MGVGCCICLRRSQSVLFQNFRERSPMLSPPLLIAQLIGLWIITVILFLSNHGDDVLGTIVAGSKVIDIECMGGVLHTLLICGWLFWLAQPKSTSKVNNGPVTEDSAGWKTVRDEGRTRVRVGVRWVRDDFWLNAIVKISSPFSEKLVLLNYVWWRLSPPPFNTFAGAVFCFQSGNYSPTASVNTWRRLNKRSGLWRTPNPTCRHDKVFSIHLHLRFQSTRSKCHNTLNTVPDLVNQPFNFLNCWLGVICCLFTQ
jgi:hypothetical protein